MFEVSQYTFVAAFAALALALLLYVVNVIGVRGEPVKPAFRSLFCFRPLTAWALCHFDREPFA